MTDSRLFYQYQLHRPLGGGWLGPVHAATDLDENREVAVRLVDDANVAQSFLLMQLERLLIKVSTLRHPHILPTGLLEQREKHAFYAMDLAQQGSARQLLQRQGRAAQGLPIVTVVEMIRQAANGLAHAHAQGLMHGDLKPENLLLQPGRALLGHTGYLVQLADFGLAELRVGASGTHDRVVVNALAYTSPEQTRGVRNELRTDIYTLGLILYELATGMVPFDIRDAADALEKHQHVAPRQPSALRPDIPEALEEIILTCLAKSPEDRYASAEELEQALQLVLNGLMPGGPEPTVRLPTLPVMPTPPEVTEPSSGTQPRLLVYSERHELLRNVPLAAGTSTVGRAPGNTVLLEHAGVSRHHLSVEFTNGVPYVTELTATNGTLMDGLPLTPMTRLRWPYRTPLYLRPYWLVVLGPEEQKARARIVVKPQEERLTLVPGQARQLEVLLANTGQTVDHFQLSIDGIPAAWLQNPYTEVQLNPGTQTSATLTLLAPKTSDSRAGTYDATILARSREDTAQYGRAALKVDVAPFQDVIATITPPMRRTWRRTRYTFKLENRSNIDGVFTPALQDTEGQIRWLPRPQELIHLDQFVGRPGMVMPRVVDPTQVAREATRQLQAEALMRGGQLFRQALAGEGRIKLENLPAVIPLKAGQSVQEEMQVRVPLRWVGMASQHPFTVDVKDALDDREDKPNVTSAEAQLHHMPLIPLWLLPILLLLLGLLIWWLTRPPAINDFDTDVAENAIRPGQPFTLRWDTDKARRVKIVELGENGQSLPVDGTFKLPAGISKEQKYTIEARNLIGTKRSRTLTISPKFARPVIEEFKVSPARVAGNKPVTITWRVKDAGQVSISELGQVPASGTRTFVPSKDLNLKIVARNGTETAEDSATVTVAGAQILFFKVNPEKITRGGKAMLKWQVEDATSVTIEGLGTVKASGMQAVTPSATTTYTINARGGNNTTTTATARLEVAAAAPKVTALTVTPTVIDSDSTQPIQISWKTESASSVTLQSGMGGAQTVSAFGTETLTTVPPATTQIVVTAMNDEGVQDTRAVTLTVRPVDAEAKKKAEEIRLKQEEEKRLQAEEKANIGKITFTADPMLIQGKGDVNLNWNAPGFKNVLILPLKGPRDGVFETTGSYSVENLNRTTTYTLRVYLRKGGKIDIPRTVKVVPLPVKVNTFTASPATLTAAGNVTLNWDVANADAVRLKGVPGPLAKGLWPAKGQTSVPVKASTTFVLTAGDQVARAPVALNLPPAQIRAFQATPGSFSGSGTAVLSWDVANATAVKIDGVRGPNADGSWPAQGKTTVRVTKTTTYTLRARQATGTAQVTVTPLPAQIQGFKAEPAVVNAGEKVTLTWKASGVPTVRIANLPAGLSNRTYPATGKISFVVTKTSTFQLTAGNASSSAGVVVRPGAPVTPPQPPETTQAAPKLVYFTANPPTIRAGESVKLSWKVLNTQNVVIDGIPGAQPAVGSVTLMPGETTTYTLKIGSIVWPLKVPVRQQAVDGQSPYRDLQGTWKHPFGTFTITNVQGRSASGTFVSERDNLRDLPLDISFAGQTLVASSPDLKDFKIVLTLDTSRQSFRGTYTARGPQERWCAYRPGVAQPSGCQ